jgi:site-specific DNA-methyltransferase (adenine-specific)
MSGEILLGDCIEILPGLEDKSAQIIICDPPYNIGKDFEKTKYKLKKEEYVSWCEKWIKECIRILRDDGTMFIYGYSETLAEICVSLPDNLNKKWLVWHYTNRTSPSLNFWQKSHESILVIWKDKKIFNRDLVRVPYSENYGKLNGKTRHSTPGRFSDGTTTTIYKVNPLGALPKDVIKIPCLAGNSKQRVNHPTQKPIELCETLIKSCKQKDGIVLVPFAGSGSECIASKNLGINYIGIEINEKYIEVIKSREVDSSLPLKLDGELFKCNSWKNNNSFKSFKKKPTQFDFYSQNESSSEILELVSLNPKAFGTVCEEILKETLNLSPRIDTTHDATFTYNSIVYKIEIKVGRYLQSSDDCMWQHIEPSYNYDYLLCCLLDFDGFRIWYITKKNVLKLIEDGLVKKQGKQGFICRKNTILPHLIEIKKSIYEIF